ncbi:hypothetical protein Tco_0425955 [Tanacetum coccineum]
MQEDQTGSNSGKLHLSLAGPNPEHMDDEFLATAYPKVLENLKLTTDEHESDSTIPDPSHQTVTSTPPVIAPFTKFPYPKPSSLVTPPPINTEATITPFIALQLRVARLEQEMSEVKKTDHSANVLASIESQVPTVVVKYLDLIKKYSALPGLESIKNQESEKSPKEIIRIKREQGVPDESTVISRASSEGTGSKPGVPDEETKPDPEEIYNFFICSFTDTSVIDLSSPKPVSPPCQESFTITFTTNIRTIAEQFSSCNGLVPQPPSPTPNVPPTKNDWDSVFCPMFDEYFNPSPSVVQPVLVAVVQEPVVSTGTHSSTRIDQDTPFTSTSQTTQEEQSHVTPTSVEEDDYGIEVAHMDNDL